MEKSKKTLDESLGKIKFMMNYDSSKTLLENEGTIENSIFEQVKPGEMAWKTAAGTAGAAALGHIGAPIVATAMGAGAAAPFAATLGAVGLGAAALGLIPLILWLNDKDKMRPKIEKLFKYVEANKAKIDQIPRGVSDEDIWNASDTLYAAMRRLGTRERDVYKVFESLQTVSDLSALITFYNQDNTVPLMKQLDRDFDQTREWMRIYRPVRNLVLRFKQQAEELGKEKQAEQGQEPDATAGGAAATAGGAAAGYKFVKGTSDDPYKYGSLGSGIAQVQQALGVVQDGKWGPKTQVKMQELAPEYLEGYTNENLMKVIQQIRSKTTSPIAKAEVPSLVRDPSTGSPSLAQKTDTTRLAGAPRLAEEINGKKGLFEIASEIK